MTAEYAGGDAVNTSCPLRCHLRHGEARDALSATHDHVDWAGLPVNLDFAFSQQQCDKVYRQHLMRKQGAQLWRGPQDGVQQCACDIAAQAANDRHNAAKLGINS